MNEGPRIDSGMPVEPVAPDRLLPIADRMRHDLSAFVENTQTAGGIDFIAGANAKLHEDIQSEAIQLGGEPDYDCVIHPDERPDGTRRLTVHRYDMVDGKTDGEPEVYPVEDIIDRMEANGGVLHEQDAVVLSQLHTGLFLQCSVEVEAGWTEMEGGLTIQLLEDLHDVMEASTVAELKQAARVYRPIVTGWKSKLETQAAAIAGPDDTTTSSSSDDVVLADVRARLAAAATPETEEVQAGHVESATESEVTTTGSEPDAQIGVEVSAQGVSAHEALSDVSDAAAQPGGETRELDTLREMMSIGSAPFFIELPMKRGESFRGQADQGRAHFTQGVEGRDYLATAHYAVQKLNGRFLEFMGKMKNTLPLTTELIENIGNNSAESAICFQYFPNKPGHGNWTKIILVLPNTDAEQMFKIMTETSDLQSALQLIQDGIDPELNKLSPVPQLTEQFYGRATSLESAPEIKKRTFGDENVEKAITGKKDAQKERHIENADDTTHVSTAGSSEPTIPISAPTPPESTMPVPSFVLERSTTNLLLDELAVGVGENGHVEKVLGNNEMIVIMGEVIRQLVAAKSEDITVNIPDGGLTVDITSGRNGPEGYIRGNKVKVSWSKLPMPATINVGCRFGNKQGISNELETRGDLLLQGNGFGQGKALELAEAAVRKFKGIDLREEAAIALQNPNEAVKKAIEELLAPTGVTISDISLQFNSDGTLSIGLDGAVKKKEPGRTGVVTK